jgi:hypothetical protein
MLRFAGEVFVFVLHVAAADFGLEVAGVFDAVGRVHVDHLHLARHALLDQERVHHQERIPENEAVCPTDFVAVELDLLVSGQGRLAEECKLRLRLRRTASEDRLRGDAFVDMERDDVHLERGVLRFASPDELRVQMGIVGSSAWFAVRGPRRWVQYRRAGCSVRRASAWRKSRTPLASLGVVFLLRGILLTPSHQ